MKKILLTVATALLLTPVALRADEGMWLLPLLEKMNSDAMRNLGSRLTPEQIYSINNSSIKDAVVQFGGGCTAEIISGSGLLVTNHHCGYSNIQALSSTEHNYLEDGYFAMTREEELPCPGLTVRFLQSMTDVTDLIAAGKDRRELIAEAGKENPKSEVRIVSFYNENDNEPADYSPDNVPMRPRQFLNISLKGVQEGDFAMIMGYPGSTQRFQTAAELNEMIAQNDIRIAARGIRQDIIWKAMRADEKVGIQYASKYSGSSNGRKKWIGEKKAFEDLDIIGREEQKERELSAWIAADPERQAAWGDAIQTIAEVTEAAKPVLHAGTLLNETIARIEICTFGANMAVVPDYLEQMRKRNPDATIDEQQILDEVLEFLDDKYKDYDANVDREVAIALIDHYKANVDPFVDNLFKKSIFTSKEKLHAKPLSLKALASDPAVQLGKALLDALDPISEQVHELDAKATEASKAYTAALLKWQEGKPSYPDANSTCRFTYGTVKSYEPKDGVLYKHYTTLKGVMEKEDPDNYEFRVPARLKEIYQTKDYGQYANEDGEVVTCFLTNNDITGGNSGSHVMDADGNLIGLAFDGNWESMSSDVMFEPNLQRCICVDIRYVLLMVDKFAGAGYLLNEMNIVR